MMIDALTTSSRECKQSEQSECLLDCVSEFNVGQVLAHGCRRIRAAWCLASLTEKTVGEMASSDLGIAVVVLVLTASLHERNFVVPPHDIAPIRLVVFLELGIELQVLSDAHHDVL